MDHGAEKALATFVAGDLAAATALAQRALESAHAASDLAGEGEARWVLGQIAHDQLRYGPSRDLLARAARELEASLGGEHELTRAARAALAIALHELGDDEGAEARLAEAETGLDEPRAPLGVRLAGVYVTVGVAHEALRRPERARRTLQGVVDALEAQDAATNEPAALATAHLQLASSLRALRDKRGSRDSLERCHELRVRAFGPSNARVAAVRFGLARELADAGELDAALVHAREAMDVLRELRLEREPRASSAHATLGLVLLMSGDTEAGTRCFETAAAMEEKTFGTSHPSTATMLVLLAQVHAGLRNWGKAAGLCKRIVPALIGQRRDTDALATACEIETQALVAMGRATDARARATRCIGALREAGAGPNTLARAHASLARALIATGATQRCIETLERALELATDGDDADLVARLGRELALLRAGMRPVRDGA